LIFTSGAGEANKVDDLSSQDIGKDSKKQKIGINICPKILIVTKQGIAHHHAEPF